MYVRTAPDRGARRGVSTEAKAPEWRRTRYEYFTSVIYNIHFREHTGLRPAEKLLFRSLLNPQKHIKNMGDKSPKSNQKKTSQKTAKASSADQKKKAVAAAAARPAAGKKK